MVNGGLNDFDYAADHHEQFFWADRRLLMEELGRVLKFHLGTIFFGAFIVALIQLTLVREGDLPAHAPPDFGHNAVPAPGGEGEAKAHGGSAAMLLGALSVHSMLETMALAVARTKTAALLLSASIALHQPAESLALVVALLRSGMPSRRLLRLLLTFTAMGPIGAGLGLGLQRAFGGAIGTCGRPPGSKL